MRETIQVSQAACRRRSCDHRRAVCAGILRSVPSDVHVRYCKCRNSAGRIDTTVPEQMKESDLEDLLLLVPQKDADTVREAYREGTKKDLNTDESFYVLKDSVAEDEEKSEELFDILGEPMLLAEGLSSDSDELGAMKDQMMHRCRRAQYRRMQRSLTF